MLAPLSDSQPMAAGSGIPLIKSYLNGVRVPGLLSLRAFISKCVGVVLSILGGLACGKVNHASMDKQGARGSVNM